MLSKDNNIYFLQNTLYLVPLHTKSDGEDILTKISAKTKGLHP